MKSDASRWTFVEQHFDAHPYPYHLYMDTLVNEFPKTLGEGLTGIFIFYERGQFIQFFEEKDWNRLSRKAAEKLNNPDFAKNVAINARKGVEKLFKAGKKILSANLTRADNKMLAQMLEELNHAFIYAGAWGVIIAAAEHENAFVSKKIQEMIKNRSTSSIDNQEAFTALTYWPEATYIYKEREDLLRIAHRVEVEKISEAELTKEIQAHSKKFGWTAFAFQGPALDEHYFRAALQDSIKRGETLENFYLEEKRKNETRERYLQKLNFSQEERELISTLVELVFLKALRKDAEFHANYVLSFVFKEIAKRFDISLNQARFMLADEILAALREDNVNRAELAERTKKFVYSYYNKELKLYSGEETEKFRKLIPHEERQEVHELHGEIASKGIGKGLAKIVMGKQDYSKFKEGDVLVAVATNPNMVPLMKLASAIVTDIGGMTCHAAIVSRELGKPCVIGTKIATKALRDGDEIEVDADKGIVRKVIVS